MQNNKVSDLSSNSYAECSVEESIKKKRRSFFIKHLLNFSHSSNNENGGSTFDCDGDLTPGSLEVWVDLPDAIKYDPSLAPFKQLYEQQHGKLEQSIDNEEKRTTFHQSVDLGVIGEDTVLGNSSIKEGEHRLVEVSTANTKKTQSPKKKQIDKVLRCTKLVALITSWVLLTVSLLLNTEKTDIILHTAVAGGVVKEYPLKPTEDRLKLILTLTGPFIEDTGNETAGEVLEVWLQRRGSEDQQNSSIWKIKLQDAMDIDFSPSVTESKTLTLDKMDIVLETSNGSVPVSNNHTISIMMYTKHTVTVPLTVSIQLNPIDEEDGIIYATVLLLSLYVLIIFEVVNRTLAALLSSSVGVGVLAAGGQRPALAELVSWLDVETLLLLFSMMLLVAILAETGLFDYLAVLAFEVTGGRTWPLVNCLCVFTALFSTFLDNVTTVLLMTPVTIRLCEVMQLNPVPVLMAMVVFSNVGGAATPVGDPPNLIIATHPAVLNANINFTTFTVHMGLGILLVSMQTYLQMRWMFRDMSKLRHSVPVDIQEMRQEIAVWRRAAGSLSSYSRDEDIVRKALEKQVDKLNTALLKREAGGASKTDPKFCSTLAEMKQKYKIRDKQLLIKSAICVTFVVIVFFLHAIPELQRLSLGWTALLGALLLLVLAERDDLEPILARVEWSTLLFFAALFVLMEALSKLGLISWIGKITESIIVSVGEESRLAVAILLVLWVSGLASAFVDNIPLTSMMVRVMGALAAPRGLGLPLAPLAWALSFGACLGGNGTLIGASANVVCAGVAEQHGYRFTFLEFLKFGFPIMIGNLLVASVYLLVCHCVFQWH